jgi:hypothetical protein
MNENQLVNRRIVLLLIALGACARLVPHPWNFAPIMAIGLYAGARSTKLWAGILLTLFGAEARFRASWNFKPQVA